MKKVKAVERRQRIVGSKEEAAWAHNRPSRLSERLILQRNQNRKAV